MLTVCVNPAGSCYRCCPGLRTTGNHSEIQTTLRILFDLIVILFISLGSRTDTNPSICVAGPSISFLLEFRTNRATNETGALGNIWRPKPGFRPGGGGDLV